MSASFFDFSFDPGRIVALVPTLMSVACSANIARLIKYSPAFAAAGSSSSGNKRSNNKYNNQNYYSTKRILMGVSLCEVVSSVAFSLQSLFIPRVASHFLWAIGTRSALGVCMQFTISSYIFASVVSFVYLSKSIRHGGTNQDFVAKRIEPWMGALGFGYPVVTSCVGAGMRIYSNLEFGVNNSNFRSDAVTQQRMQDWLNTIRRCWFPGYPITILIAAVVFNSFVMHALTARVHRGRLHKGTDVSRTNGVATVAVLLTYIWTAILRVFESNDLRNNSQAGFFPLMLLQAFFLPAIGLLNLSTWLKPRYLRVQQLYPMESSTWWFLRALLGAKIRPSVVVAAQNSNRDDFAFTSRRHCRF